MELHGITALSPPSMPFIVSCNIDKADSATRKLIRSHVMRGKKQKGKRGSDKGNPAAKDDASQPITSVRFQMEDLPTMYTQQIPGRVGSDASCLHASDEIAPPTIMNIVKVSPAATKIISPLVASIGFRGDSEYWPYPIRPDIAALHITAFALESFISRVLQGQEGKVNEVAMMHFQRGIKLLRERLLGEDDEVKVSDSTMGIVTKLASTAHFDEDAQASRRHMEGLRKMVDLRSGLGVFKGTHLLVEMLKCDLGIALLNGTDPVFFRQPTEPTVGYPEKLSETDEKAWSREFVELMRDKDDDLAMAWRVMRRFCMLVNLGAQTKRMMKLDIIHDTMTATMYRLLDMQYPVGSADETLRLGLLAFSYHVFLQWQDMKRPRSAFAAAYRRSLQLADGFSPPVMLWLLVVGANAVFDVREDGWLREGLLRRVDGCGIKAWGQMEDVLKSLLWISFLDEQAGKDLFELLSR